MDLDDLHVWGGHQPITRACTPPIVQVRSVLLDSPPAILNEVLMRVIGVVSLALSLVLALRAVEAQQALRELDDALADIRC
jgi:hypothetical protein